MMMERKITVSLRYRRNRLSTTMFPEIRLSGLWLKACGFTRGQKVIVTYNDNEIRIKKE